MLPLRESLISFLVQAKLATRRTLRRWRLGSRAQPPSRAPVLLDDGADERHEHPLQSTAPDATRKRRGAILPTRARDRDPLPRPTLVTLLFVLSLAVRVFRIAEPPSVVFDEVHFLRFVKGYYNGEYIFDIHPPLGKLLLLVVTRLFCGAPALDYSTNGEPFGQQRYTPLRWTSALFGAGVAPLSYLICRELGLSAPAALLPALTHAVEHLGVVEARLALVDAQLLFFVALCLLLALRLWGARKRSRRRRAYLVGTALSGAAALGVKWTALVTPGLVAVVSLLGRPFPAQGSLEIREMGLAGALAAAFYMSLFAVHFYLLPKSGRGDAFMKRAFQATLVGNKYYKPGAKGPGFLRNFLYLNWEMYTANAHIKARHHWESKWYQWIINQRGLLYFNEPEEETMHLQKIYLIVNPVVTVMTIVALVAFIIVAIFIYLPRRYHGRLASYSRLHGFASRGAFFLAGYVLNLLPYVEVARCTFLYHYLPALFYALLGAANLVDAIPSLRVQRALVGGYTVALLTAFVIWSPWIYATPLSDDAHKWRQLWGRLWQ